jgi:SMI1 / KNR4 family (SUKH-1)
VAKRKKAQPWDAVFDRVRVFRAPEDVCSTVSEADLAAAETALGVPLPASYRAFAIRFGLGGCFWWIFRLSALVAPKKKNQQYTVIGWTRWMQNYIVGAWGDNMSLPQEQLRRFIFFGDDCGGGSFAWDPGEPTSTNPVEYPIYYYPRTESQVGRRANSFVEFVQWVDTYSREITNDEEEKTAAYIRWEPNAVRKKKKPLKRDVNLWLASNNHTARDLALSIRDHGRVDGFPILADALQEAGCSNADLLDSCRTGDPDIDGAWVLQVLLGKV